MDLKLVLFSNIWCMSVLVLGVLDIGHGIDYLDDIGFEDWIDGEHSPLVSTVSRTVKRYYCSLDISHRDGAEIESLPLVYGVNSWKFPAQDVNLKLSYPLANSTVNHTALITTVEVLLHFNGKESQGFITDGGILQDHISLSFVIKNITQLRYQFWLHGNKISTLPTSNAIKFCSPGDSTIGIADIK